MIQEEEELKMGIRNCREVLLKHFIDPDDPIITKTNLEGLEELCACFAEHCPNSELKILELPGEILSDLLNAYASSCLLYHPEADHQERGAFIEMFVALMEYGMSQDDLAALEFL
jgi:hypothetical protein